MLAGLQNVHLATVYILVNLDVLLKDHGKDIHTTSSYSMRSKLGKNFNYERLEPKGRVMSGILNS